MAVLLTIRAQGIIMVVAPMRVKVQEEGGVTKEQSPMVREIQDIPTQVIGTGGWIDIIMWYNLICVCRILQSVEHV